MGKIKSFKTYTMKKIKFLTAALFLFAAFGLVSCTADNEPIDPAIDLGGGGGGGGGNGGGGSSTYYIKVLQDGVQKQWTTTQASVFSLGTNTKSLLILGSDGSTSMNLHLTNENGNTIPVGVYPLEWTTIGCGYTEGANIFSSDYSDFSTSAGNITITEFDTVNLTVKGVFNFTGKNDGMTISKVFTNGEFFVKYVNQ